MSELVDAIQELQTECDTAVARVEVLEGKLKESERCLNVALEQGFKYQARLQAVQELGFWMRVRVMLVGFDDNLWKDDA